MWFDKLKVKTLIICKIDIKPSDFRNFLHIYIYIFPTQNAG